MASPSETIITYFPIRGRAEPIRLILEELGVPYKENTVDGPAWGELKPKMPFGKIPMFEDDGYILFESHAIYRYLGRKYDLYGENESERIQCDILEQAISDGVEAFSRLTWSSRFDEKRPVFIETQLSVTLANLEQFLAKSDRDKNYWVGKKFTYVDFLGWTYLDYMRALAGDIVNDYPNLAHLKDFFETRPKISAYLNSDRRHKTITVPMATFGGTPETS